MTASTSSAAAGDAATAKPKKFKMDPMSLLLPHERKAYAQTKQAPMQSMKNAAAPIASTSQIRAGNNHGLAIDSELPVDRTGSRRSNSCASTHPASADDRFLPCPNPIAFYAPLPASVPFVHSTSDLGLPRFRRGGATHRSAHLNPTPPSYRKQRDVRTSARRREGKSRRLGSGRDARNRDIRPRPPRPPKTTLPTDILPPNLPTTLSINRSKKSCTKRDASS